MADLPKIQAPPPAFCHRFYSPLPIVEEGINPITRQPGRSVTHMMGNFPCQLAKCTLYDAERKECLDVTAIKAKIRQAEATEQLVKGLEQLDGFLRMSADQG